MMSAAVPPMSTGSTEARSQPVAKVGPWVVVDRHDHRIDLNVDGTLRHSQRVPPPPHGLPLSSRWRPQPSGHNRAQSWAPIGARTLKKRIDIRRDVRGTPRHHCFRVEALARFHRFDQQVCSPNGIRTRAATLREATRTSCS